MVTRFRPQAEARHEEGFYVWIEVQAERLCARQFGALDLDNLIEEVEASGRAERKEVLNTASIVIEHLLKLQFSPTQAPRYAWRASIREHRRRMRRGITSRLRQILAAELPVLYAEARDDTAALLRDHGESSAADATQRIRRVPRRLEGSCSRGSNKSATARR